MTGLKLSFLGPPRIEIRGVSVKSNGDGALPC